MSIVRRIVKNTAWLYFAEIICKILQFLLVLVIARHYGVESFGDYSVAIVFTLLTSMLIDFGMNTLIIRELARKRGTVSKYLFNVLFIKLIFGVVSFALMVFLVNILSYSKSIHFLVYSFGIYQVLFQLIEFIKSLFRAYEMMCLDSIVKITEKVISTSAALLLIYLGFDLIHVSLVFIFSGLLTFIMSLFLIKKKITKFNFRLDKEFIKNFIKKSIPFALILIAYTIYLRVDILLISALKGSFSTGMYSAAMQFIDALLFVTIFFSMSIYPLLSQSYVTNKKRFFRIYALGMKVLLVIATPIVASLFALSDRIILLFLGQDYLPAGRILQILLFFLFLNFFTQFGTTVLVSMNKEIKLLKMLFISMILSVILGFGMIKYFSIIGAAMSRVIVELAALTIVLYMISARPNLKSLWLITKSFLAGILLFLIVKTFINENLIFIIFVGIISYALLLLVFRIINSEDLKLVKEVFNFKIKTGVGSKKDDG